MMYWFGTVLSPAMAVVGFLLLVAGFTGNHHDGLAIAGAILLGAVLIAGKWKS